MFCGNVVTIVTVIVWPGVIGVVKLSEKVSQTLFVLLKIFTDDIFEITPSTNTFIIEVSELFETKFLLVSTTILPLELKLLGTTKFQKFVRVLLFPADWFAHT